MSNSRFSSSNIGLGNSGANDSSNLSHATGNPIAGSHLSRNEPIDETRAEILLPTPANTFSSGLDRMASNANTLNASQVNLSAASAGGANEGGESNEFGLPQDSSLDTAGHPPGVFPEFDELAEQIGEFIHYWGFKRIHGRIWTHLFLAKRPVDAGELVSQLQISKALVSISLRELLDYQVILDIGKSPRGTNLYRTNPDLLSVITSVLRQREKRMLSRISAAQESLSRTQLKHREEAGLSDDNLLRLKEMVDRASDGLDSVISLGSFDFGSLMKVLKP